MTKDEALKLALDALESATPKYTRQRADQKTLGGALDYWKLEQHKRLKAITSLRQAIAEAEKQQPLFWYRPRSDGFYEGPIHNAQIETVRQESGAWEPLYTHPPQRTEQPAQRTWVGLTEQDLDYLCNLAYTGDEEFALAVQAKLMEKNA